MIKGLLTFTIGLVALTGCNNIPEVKPVNYQILSVYPNPASELAYITVGNQITQAFTLQVFDTRGKVLLEEKGSNRQMFTLVLDDKPVGKYHVVLKTDKVVASQKLIKL